MTQIIEHENARILMQWPKDAAAHVHLFSFEQMRNRFEGHQIAAINESGRVVRDDGVWIDMVRAAKLINAQARKAGAA